MKGLLIMDYYNVRHSLKIILLILIFYALIFLPTAGSGSFVIVSAVMINMVSLNTITYDKQSGWDNYAIVMPVSRKKLLLSRFIFMFLSTLAGVAIGVISSLAWAAFLFLYSGEIFPVSEMLFISYCIFFYCISTGSIIIYTMLRLGFENGKIISVVVYFLTAFIIVLLLSALKAVAITDNLFILGGLILLPVMTFIIWTVMFHLSYKFVSRQDY